MINRKLTSSLVTLSTTLTVLLTSSSYAHALLNTPSGLQTAIKTALEKNPKIRSNDKILEAMLLRVDAEKKSQLPSVGLGYTAYRDSGSTEYSGSNQSNPYKTTYQNADLTFNVTIFDGFAKYYRIKSMECNFKQQQANYNSTNTLMRNTQGQLATLVVQYYVALSKAKQNIQFTTDLIHTLQKLRTATKTSGEQAEIDNMINNSMIDLKQAQADELSAANNYQYVVTVPAPSHVDTYEEMIESLAIPKNADDAMQIALEKSPEIKTAKYKIECMGLNYKSTKASIYSPRVDASISRTFGNSTTDEITGSSYSSGGTTAMVTVRMNFGAGNSSELSAQQKEIEAAKDNLDGTIADSKHDIDSNYPDLANAISFAESYKQNYIIGLTRMNDYLQDIDNHKPINVSDALKELGNNVGNWYQSQRFTATVLNTKFQIQKNVGTLFQSLGIQENETSDLTVR